MLILASASPRRREILRSIGIDFRVIIPNWSEPPFVSGQSPARYAIANARSKALSVADRVNAGFVIGVDTIVVLDGKVLGKPEDRAEARAMLRKLSGRSHAVISGVAVAGPKPPMDADGRSPAGDRNSGIRVHRRSSAVSYRVLTGSEKSLVTFRPLTDMEIRRYVASKEPYDKAGGYGIQGRAGDFVTKVSGCYLNVVGLPVALLLRLLARAGWHER